MKLLHLIDSFAMGGAEVFVRDLAIEQAAEGHQVHVCSMMKSHDAVSESLFCSQLENARVTVHKLEKIRYQANPALLFTMRRLLTSLDLDIVHSHTISPDLHAAIAMTGLSRPVLMRTLHSTAFAPGKLKQLAERILRHKFKVSVVISDGVEDWALAQGFHPSSLAKVYNGINLRTFDAAPKLDRASIPGCEDPSIPLLISVGRMNQDEVKGWPYLLEACAILASHAISFRLLLVGDGEMRSQYMQWVEEHGLAAHVYFTGLRHDVASLLKAADLFVLASLREGFSLSVLEAGAASLPIIASRIPTIESVLREGVDGLLVPVRSPKAIAAAIEQVLQDDELRQRLGRSFAGRVREAFSMKRVALDYMALYRSLTNQ